MAKKSPMPTTMGVEDVEMPIRLHLEGKHAKKFAKHKIGAKVKFMVHGKKTSHSVFNQSGKGDSHSVGIDIHKIEEQTENPTVDANETSADEGNEMKAGKVKK